MRGDVKRIFLVKLEKDRFPRAGDPSEEAAARSRALSDRPDVDPWSLASDAGAREKDPLSLSGTRGSTAAHFHPGVLLRRVRGKRTPSQSHQSGISLRFDGASRGIEGDSPGRAVQPGKISRRPETIQPPARSLPIVAG